MIQFQFRFQFLEEDLIVLCFRGFKDLTTPQGIGIIFGTIVPTFWTEGCHTLQFLCPEEETIGAYPLLFSWRNAFIRALKTQNNYRA